jgi:tRNA dimethylallyltransferase
MVGQGALAEIQALLDMQLPPDLPAMRAQGVPELAAHLRGEISLDDAIGRAVLANGQYTKRQATWFRNRPLAPPEHVHTIHARVSGLEQFSESALGEIIAFICKAG